MTDYHPLIARAVDGLAKNTGDARRAVYERARSALVAQLRGVEPALSESDITNARRGIPEPTGPARTEPRFEMRSQPASSPAAPSLPRVDLAADNEKPKSTARSRILQARTSPLDRAGLRRSRGTEDEPDVLGAAIAKAAQTARDPHDSYESFSRSREPQTDDYSPLSPSEERMEPQFEDDLRSSDDNY